MANNESNTSNRDWEQQERTIKTLAKKAKEDLLAGKEEANGILRAWQNDNLLDPYQIIYQKIIDASYLWTQESKITFMKKRIRKSNYCYF